MESDEEPIKDWMTYDFEGSPCDYCGKLAAEYDIEDCEPDKEDYCIHCVKLIEEITDEDL
jgi:GH18 family chitinase